MRRLIKLSCLFLLSLTISSQTHSQELSKEQLRQQQADQLLFQLNEQIKTVDEPTLRIFIRLRYVSFLWSGKAGSASEKAEPAATAAIDDFLRNEKELLPLYQKVFRRDLLALIKLHSPALVKKYADQFAAEPQSLSDVAYSMINGNDGAGPAAKLIESSLNNGETSGMDLVFVLGQLEQQQPALVTEILSAFLNSASTRPSEQLLESLFWLQSFYLKRDNSDPLKVRFLSLIVDATSNTDSISDAQHLSYAYDLLSQTMPQIETLLPAKYTQAQSQLTYLSVQSHRDNDGSDGVQARIRASEDPLGQTITEAHSASSTALRDELLVQAAQMALEKDKLELTLDLAKDISSEGAIQTARQEILSDLVAKAIKENKPTIAEKASLEIDAPLQRATELRNIALFYQRSKDTFRSRQMLLDSLKQIDLVDNSSPKAVAFLKTAEVYQQIDQSRVLPLVQSALDVTDRFLFHKEDSQDKPEPFTFDMNNTVAVAWNLIPEVQFLVKTNEDNALVWINSVRNPGMKASALLGATIELFEVAPQKTPAPPKPRAKKS